MRKIALAGLLAVAAVALLVPPSEASGRRFHHRPVYHSRVFIGVGPAYYWGPYPYPYYYYPPPYAVYTPPPVVVQEQPPVYVQQTPPAAPTTPPAAAANEQFWYFCQSSNAYYPSVSSCPEAWVKVAPRP